MPRLSPQSPHLYVDKDMFVITLVEHVKYTMYIYDQGWC